MFHRIKVELYASCLLALLLLLPAGSDANALHNPCMPVHERDALCRREDWKSV
jgi:hypothetical protein